MTIIELEAAVLALTDANDLNRIVSAIKFARDRQTSTAALAFTPGTTVSFVAKGRRITGVIESINRKSLSLTRCSVEGAPTGNWRVAPSLCTKVTA